MSDLARFVTDLGPDLAGPPNQVMVGCVDSTNRLARRVIATYQAEETVPPEFLVLALEQSSGRGRLGRPWASPPGAGVYGTRVLPLPGEGREAVAEALQSLPLLAGIGLARPLNRLLLAAGSSRRCTLKWPNDLLVAGAKIGGVLAESLALGDAPPVALVGFGINYDRARRGPELPPGATTFADHAGAERPTLAGFVGEVTAGLEAELVHLGDLAYAVAAYRELSAHRPGEHLRCRTGAQTTEGEFQGFDEQGHLKLIRDGETVLLSAGEIVER